MALLARFLRGLTLVVIRRLAGTVGFVVVPRRWVVERKRHPRPLAGRAGFVLLHSPLVCGTT